MNSASFSRPLFCALLIGLTVALCVAVPAQEHSSSNASIVTITQADDGKSIEVNAGQRLQVKLPSNPSTGFDWTLSGDPAPLKLRKTFHVKNSKSSTMPGSPRTTVFELSMGASGVTNLTFVYRRSWEYNVAPAKTFSVRVNVR